MPLSINEEVLTSMGFVQQSPQNIWDYPVNGKSQYGEGMIRFVKSNYGGKDTWTFQYGSASYPTICADVMAMAMLMVNISFNRGVRETQDKVHEALGLSRLADMIAERTSRDE